MLSPPENTKRKKPLIIFLHGSGEKGTDIEKVKVHGPLNIKKIMIWTLMFWLLNVQKTNIGILKYCTN
jgi:predicted peptidase